MFLFGFIQSIFGVIDDTRSFIEKVHTNLIMITYYKECNDRCAELKKATEYMTMKYYFIDVSKDKDAAENMNKFGISAESQYPVMFFKQNIYPNPYDNEDIENLLVVVKKQE